MLPSLNFNSRLTTTDWQAQHDVYERELTLRLLAVFGGLPNANMTPSYGIVARANPSSVSAAMLPYFPLQVFPNADLTVDVNAGFAITRSGMIIEVKERVKQAPIASTAIGAVNVAFLEFETQASDVLRLNRYSENLPIATVYSPVKVKIVTLPDYRNSQQFTPTRRDNIVELGYLTVTQNAATGEISLLLDNGKTFYPDNRPWFSPVDVFHRSKLGTGVQTETNPHALSINDLSLSGMTLYQQLSNHGFILSKDSAVPNLPGTKVCYDVIDEARVRVDPSGFLTRESKFGGVGARYIRLSAFPCRIGSAYHRMTPANRVAIDWIVGSDIVVFPPTESIPALGINIEYTEAESLAPYPNPATNTVLFKQVMRVNEIAISRGLSLPSLPVLGYSFDSYGPFARKYTIYAAPSSGFFAYPAIVFAPTKMEELGTVLRQIPQTLPGPSRLAVGLTGALPSASLSVTVRFTGLDVNGTNSIEDVTFNQLNWVDNIPPAAREETKQFQRTLTIWSQVNTIQVLGRYGDGTASVIGVWAEIDSHTSSEVSACLPCATVFWDGVSLAELRDIRPVTHKLTAPFTSEATNIQLVSEHNLQALAVLDALSADVSLTKSTTLLFTEDFKRPRYWDWTNSPSNAISAQASLLILDATKFNDNDTITINTDKSIIAKTTGALQNNGEFNYAGLSISQVRDNMVAAINNSTFHSQRLAAVDPADRGRIVMTSVQSGATGNFTVTASLQDSTCCAFESFTGGLDGLAQSVLLTTSDSGLNLTPYEIPNPAEYDTTSFPKHYRSQAIPLLSTQYRRKFLVQLYGLSTLYQTPQVRIRTGVSGVWGEWQVMSYHTSPTPYFLYDTTFDPDKIQLAVYASCVGVAVYALNPET